METKETKFKISRTNKVALAIMLQGVARLIEGQLKFADEFGLGRKRVFPEVHELLTDNNIEQVLTSLLASGDEGLKSWCDLFDALIAHQLALMTAIEGVVLHTMTVVEDRTKRKYNPLQVIKQLFKRKTFGTIFSTEHYKNNRQVRYKELIVPGFIDSYIQTRRSK